MVINLDKRKFSDYIVITSFVFVSSSPIIPSWFRSFLLIVLLLYLLLEIKSVSLNQRSFFFVISFSFIFFVYFVVDLFNAYYYSLNTLSFLYIPLCFYCGLLLGSKYNYKAYMNVYENVIFTLASASFILYSLVLIYPDILSYFFNYTYHEFSSKSIVILNVLTSDTGMIKRNAGFSSEPGFYQLFLNIALWWRFISRNKMDFRVLVYVISIISTNSTVGLLTIGLIFFTAGKGKFRLLALFLFLLAIVFGWNSIEYHLHSKLIGSTSFDGRFEPFLNAFKFSFENPFGIGAIQYTRLLDIENFGGWDSFSQMVLRYGYLGLIILLLFSLSIFNISKLLTVIILLSFFSQSIWYIPSVVVFFFMSNKVYNED